MNRDRMFELRVLTGVHAGARALLPQEPQVLGSGDDCDLILSDEGIGARHARLEQRDDGTTVLHWLAEDLPPLEIRPGEGARIGPVHVAVEPSDAPWRDDVPVLAGDEAPVPSTDGDAEASGHDAMQPAAAVPPGVDPPAPRGSSLRDRVIPGWVLLAALAIALGGWLASRGLSISPPGGGMAEPASSGNGGARPLPPGTQELLAAIRRLDFGSRVQVEMTEAGQPLVRAFLLSEEEAEMLANALAHLSPRPGLRLTTEQDLLVAVTDALQRQGDRGRAPLTASYVGDASFRIEGRLAEPSERSTLLEAMQRQFPQVRSFEAAIQTDAEIAAQLVAELRQRQGGEVRGDWSDGVLTLEATMARADVPRWEQALQVAASMYPVPLRARLHVIEPKEEPSPRLPFTVRTVAGSDPSYVLLGTGEKLTIDGSVAGWRVVQINAKTVVFESLRGRRISLER